MVKTPAAVIGFLGMLIEGKERGHILSVREVTTDLETIARFRVAEAVKHIIFREAGEAYASAFVMTMSTTGTMFKP